MSDRTFKLTQPHMSGDDIRLGQRELASKLAHWGADSYPIRVDGEYSIATRAAYRDVAFGLGIARADLAEGITPELRSKIRHGRLSPVERARYLARAGWRKELARKHGEQGGVSPPLVKVLTHANGWSGPSGHDGVDLICPSNAVGHAICRARVRRADKDGWWGKGAVASPGHPIGDGDGIVVLEALVDIGPIRRGMFIGYGHAEKPMVQVGEVVEAGQPICHAGFARAWHFHWMVNAGGARFTMENGKPRGVGDRDPWPIIAYCIKHA